MSKTEKFEKIIEYLNSVDWNKTELNDIEETIRKIRFKSGY